MIDHDQVQAAISARLDGEPSGLDDDVVDAHIAGCAECRSFQEEATRLSTSLRFVEPVDQGMSPPADLADMILAGVEPQWRKHASTRLVWLSLGRILLVVLAVVHVSWAVMTLSSTGGVAQVSADGTVMDPAAEPELMRLMVDSAGLRFALAVGLVAAAWKPGLIAGVAIVPATLTAFLLGFTARDIILGGVDSAQVGMLVLLVLTVLALGVTWFADRGIMLRRAWRTLTADPNF